MSAPKRRILGKTFTRTPVGYQYRRARSQRRLYVELCEHTGYVYATVDAWEPIPECSGELVLLGCTGSRHTVAATGKTLASALKLAWKHMPETDRKAWGFEL